MLAAALVFLPRPRAVGLATSTPATAESPATQPAAPQYPRIAMLWSKADVQGEDEWANIARHDVIVVGPATIGLQWQAHEFPGMSETIYQPSIKVARENLERIRRLNPSAVVLVEVYFFEDNQKAYPPDHKWWLRDKDGKKMSFWPGTWQMDISNVEYCAHVATRMRAVHEALEWRAGIFIDNVRFDADSRLAWTVLLKAVRKMCGDDMPILVNAGYMTEDQTWLAPYVNGIMYEDSIHYLYDKVKDEEAYYARIAAVDAKLRKPTISVNEIFGKRDDTAAMRRDLIRTLVYTDMAFIYSDSTHGHKHAWHKAWSAPLGRPLAGPAVPQEGRLARREFAGGTVLWLPPSAKQAVTVKLASACREFITGKELQSVELAPGSGAILIRPAKIADK